MDINSLYEILQTADKFGAKVVAATKTVDPETINLAKAHGLNYMGENRVQELLSKYDSLDFDRDHIHFIGRLQSNKVGHIINRVSLIHSLDSISLAQTIDRRAGIAGIVMPCLLEINTDLEESKGGVPAESAEELLVSLAPLKNIEVCGIMSIGCHRDTEKEYIPDFEKVGKLFRNLSSKGLLGGNPQLSMGMSDNWRLALEYGSTIIRPGTAIFGKR